MPHSFNNLRWRLFFTLALIYILVYFYRVSLAVVSADVSRDLNLTPEQLGTLAGILFYVYAVAQIPLGPLIDRIGPRLTASSLLAVGAVGAARRSHCRNASWNSRRINSRILCAFE